jgi:hypothetical protein
VKRTTREKTGPAHAPRAPQHVQDEADRAFESWFKDLRLDDKDGALFARVPKAILRQVFRVGFENGGYRHWSTLTEMGVKALVRFYAPEATVRTPEDVSSSCAILGALEAEVRKKTTDDAMQGLKLARRLAEAQRLLQGVQQAPPVEPTGEPHWTEITDHGPGAENKEQHGPGWEDHGQG